MSLATDIVGTQPVRSPRATLEQVLNAPPDKVAEIIYGELHVMTRPSTVHGWAFCGLYEEVCIPYKFDEDKGGWKFLPEPVLKLSENILLPDIAGWYEPQGLIGLSVNVVTDVPDWVCEILSPSTRHLDLGSKRDIYAKHGVGHLWLVDPQSQSVEAFEHKDGDFVSVGSVSEKGSVSLPPFEGVSFPLSLLWA